MELSAFLKNTDKNFKESSYYKKEKILKQSVSTNKKKKEQEQDKENQGNSLINLIDNYDHDKNSSDESDNFLLSIEDIFKKQLKPSSLSATSTKKTQTTRSTLKTTTSPKKGNENDEKVILKSFHLNKSNSFHRQSDNTTTNKTSGLRRPLQPLIKSEPIRQTLNSDTLINSNLSSKFNSLTNLTGNNKKIYTLSSSSFSSSTSNETSSNTGKSQSSIIDCILNLNNNRHPSYRKNSLLETGVSTSPTLSKESKIKEENIQTKVNSIPSSSISLLEIDNNNDNKTNNNNNNNSDSIVNDDINLKKKNNNDITKKGSIIIIDDDESEQSISSSFPTTTVVPSTPKLESKTRKETLETQDLIDLFKEEQVEEGKKTDFDNSKEKDESELEIEDDDIILPPVPFIKKNLKRKNLISISDDDDDDDDDGDEGDVSYVKVNRPSEEKSYNLRRRVNKSRIRLEDAKESNRELFSESELSFDDSRYGYESITSDDPHSYHSGEELFDDEYNDLGNFIVPTDEEDEGEEAEEEKNDSPTNINYKLNSSSIAPSNLFPPDPIFDDVEDENVEANDIEVDDAFINKENIPITPLTALKMKQRRQRQPKFSSSVTSSSFSTPKSSSTPPTKRIHTIQSNSLISVPTPLNEIHQNTNIITSTSSTPKKSIPFTPQPELKKLSNLNTFDPFSLPDQSLKKKSSTGLNPDFEEFLRRRGLTDRYFGRDKSKSKYTTQNKSSRSTSYDGDENDSYFTNPSRYGARRSYKRRFTNSSSGRRRGRGGRRRKTTTRRKGTGTRSSGQTTATTQSGTSSTTNSVYNHYNDTPDFGDFAGTGMGWEGLGYSYF